MQTHQASRYAPACPTFLSTTVIGCLLQISSGAMHTCVIDVYDFPKCFGSNRDSMATPPYAKFASISAGHSHTCGTLKDTFEVKCWGSNTHGQTTPSCEIWNPGNDDKGNCTKSRQGWQVHWKLDDSPEFELIHAQGKCAGEAFSGPVTDDVWARGEPSQTCKEVCSAAGGRQCNSTMQSSLTTYAAVREAFNKSGYECKGNSDYASFPGSPFSSGRPDDCAPIPKWPSTSMMFEIFDAGNRSIGLKNVARRKYCADDGYSIVCDRCCCHPLFRPC